MALPTLEITNEDIDLGFEMLLAEMLVDVKVLEFKLKSFKQLRKTVPFGRWAERFEVMRIDLHVLQMTRLYILHRGQKTYEEYNQPSHWYDSNAVADKFITQYSRLLYLQSISPWHLGRKLPRLLECSKTDRWNKWVQIREWWNHIEMEINRDRNIESKKEMSERLTAKAKEEFKKWRTIRTEV
tara:strand:+ start:240 stop:791 length:552 start_codon:yes stop_codon:yes gene_type:complete